MSDLNHLYNLVGKSINTVNDFIKYAPNAIFNNDPQFDEKYKKVENTISPYLSEINDITTQLGI